MEGDQGALSKGQIKDLIQQTSSRVTITANTSGKSVVWQNFRTISVDGKPVNFVACVNCEEILSFKSNSTTSLHRHICQKSKSTKTSYQMSLDQFKQKNIPGSSIKKLNADIVVGLALDLKPLASVEGNGFRLIAQELVNFGARFGFQNNCDFLQNRTTLQRNLHEIVDPIKMKVRNSILQAPSFPNFALTTDMWSDKYQQRNFISLTIHFLDQEFDLKSHMISVEEFPDVTKDAENIQSEIIRMLNKLLSPEEDPNKYGLTLVQSGIAVTDGGTNLISVFPRRLPCLCHRLNTLVSWTFNEKIRKREIKEDDPFAQKKKFLFKVECPNISASIDAVKATVRYFKKSGTNKKLTSSLKQEVPTRWNSLLIMIESFLKVKEEVKKILLEKKQLSRIIAINETVLEDLVKFLIPFRECTEIWSREKIPTIHEAVLWIQTINTHLKEDNNDYVEIKKMKGQARICMEEYFQLEDIYFVACAFHPKYKKLKFLDEEKRIQIYALLRKMIDDIQLSASKEIATHVELKPTPVKKTKFSDFQDSSDSNNEEEEQYLHELDKYLDLRFKMDGTSDIIQFWKTLEGFPRMQKISYWLLAIPASQTSDERVFSATGNTITPRRTELNSSTLADLTFIHKNYKS